jgi:hypothetical protein
MQCGRGLRPDASPNMHASGLKAHVLFLLTLCCPHGGWLWDCQQYIILLPAFYFSDSSCLLRHTPPSLQGHFYSPLLRSLPSWLYKPSSPRHTSQVLLALPPDQRDCRYHHSNCVPGPRAHLLELLCFSSELRISTNYSILQIRKLRHRESYLPSVIPTSYYFLLLPLPSAAGWPTAPSYHPAQH